MNAINRMYGGNLGNPMRRTRPGGVWGAAGDEEVADLEGSSTRRFIVHNMTPGSRIAIKRGTADAQWLDITYADWTDSGWVDEAGHVWSTFSVPIAEPFDVRVSRADGGGREWRGISGALTAFPGANIHFDAAAPSNGSPLMPWIFDPGVRRPFSLVFPFVPDGTRIENQEASGAWVDITGTRDASGGMTITGHSFGDPLRLRLNVGGEIVPLPAITPSTNEAFRRDPTRIVVPLSASSLPDSLRPHDRLDVSGLPADSTLTINGWTITRGQGGWSADGSAYGMNLMTGSGHIVVEARSGDICKRQEVDYVAGRPVSLSWGTMPTVRCPHTGRSPDPVIEAVVGAGGTGSTDLGGGAGGGGGSPSGGAPDGNRVSIDHILPGSRVIVGGVDRSTDAGARWVGTAYSVPVPAGASVVQVEVRAPSGEIRAASSAVSASSVSRLDWDTMRPTATADGNRVSIDHIIPGSRVIVGGVDRSTDAGARWNGTAYVVPVPASTAPVPVDVRAPSGEVRSAIATVNPLSATPLDWATMHVTTAAPASVTSGVLRIRRMPQGAHVLVNDRDVTDAAGAQWEGTDHLIYDVPTPIGSNTVTVTLANGERREVDFHNTPDAPDAEVRFDTMTIASPATGGPAAAATGGALVLKNVPEEFTERDIAAWLPVEGAAHATFTAAGAGQWKTAQLPAGTYHIRIGHGTQGASASDEVFAQAEVVDAHDTEVSFSTFTATAPWNVQTTPPPPMLTPPVPMYPYGVPPSPSAWSRLTPAEKVALGLLAAAAVGGGYYAFYQAKRI